MQLALYETRGAEPHTRIACVDRPTPAPGAGEVLLELLAAPINPSDVLTITGQYGALPPLPAVGGNEGVGRVAALGEGVTGVAIGDWALLPVGGGTWASHIVVKAAALMRVPAGGDPLQMAMLTVNPPTASLLLSEFVALNAGDWVLQNAANSGVGEYVIQLAKARGLHTVSVVRRADAVAPLEALGGDVVLVDGPDLAARVAEATGKAKIRLALDAVGGTATDRLAQTVAIGGTVVNYGAMSGEACKVAPGSFVFRNVTLRGFWLAFWFREASPAQQQALFGDLAQRIARGELATRVHATFPLSRVQEAVALAAAGGRQGKVLLTPG
ncbi:zinc-dependent alcohol dehydrogenase family protein [Gemmatimonas phototrophica]|uniref:enoyl-[acyl-carrier-protein] reductase n=1 Tax=Gemmatimonas phototrophica TaxID=1379270 RepID=A0A143BMF9_9BACT|nr:zinc-dependent alcohol dehydrogenase family protein [Gemmatimonas phototrophica]AMW05755.1 alcohol dehydrogenase [Gemmatimonas phototrophica]